MKRILLSLALALGIFSIPIPSFATVSSTTNTVQYSGDGYSTSFSFNNNVYLASDLNVYEVTAGVSTLLTLNTNYSVSLTAISGVTGAYTATINLAGGSSPAGALAVGTTLVIVRSIPYTQLINISDYSSTPAATWNQGFDRATILSQQLFNLSNRTILQAVNETTPITFPAPTANNLIGWNSSGTGLLNYTPNTSAYIPVPIPGSELASPLLISGNVGIGTTSPTHTLDVNGTINASGAITGGITSGSSLLSGNGSGGFSNVTVGTGLSFTGGTLKQGNGLGAWQPYSTGTTPWAFGQVYQASTDIIVVATSLGGSGTQSFEAYTGSASNPSSTGILVGLCESGLASGATCSVTFPVRKGDYWEEMEDIVGSTQAIYVLPVGS